jgi:uncharacterized metal-binding protein YceD (DUF177 family)
MSNINPPWSVPVALADIPDSGRRFDLAADENTRAQLAKLAGLRSLPRLKAAFDVSRQGAQGLRVTGRVTATVGQNCVVTLEPIENEMEEDVNLIFAPPRVPSARADAGVKTEIIDPAEPEPLRESGVDLGAIVTEFLILGIDPYPRKLGAKFEPPPVEDSGAHPFAALAALKKAPDGKNE